MSIIDDSDRVGLVLGGGAALGAYHIGVYNTIKALGKDTNIVAMSGSSVGALNLMFLQEDDAFNAVTKFWNNIQCGDALDGFVKDLCKLQKMQSDRLLTSDLPSQSELQFAISLIQEQLVFGKNQESDIKLDKLFRANHWLSCKCVALSSHKPLEESIKNFLHFLPNLLQPGAKPIYVTRVRAEDAKLQYVTQVNKHKEEDIVTFNNTTGIVNNALASSSSRPLYNCYTINGVNYRDGGQTGGNNIPYQILEREEKLDKIIIVSLVDDDPLPIKDKYINIKLDPSYSSNAHILNLVHFKADFAKKLIELGMQDAKRILGG